MSEPWYSIELHPKGNHWEWRLTKVYPPTEYVGTLHHAWSGEAETKLEAMRIMAEKMELDGKVM